MANSKILLLRNVLCKIVIFFLILHLFMSLWDFACAINTGSVAAPQPEQIITTHFMYFKTVFFMTLDVYLIARLSCFSC